MTTYRLFPSASGPSSPVSYSGPFLAGVLFKVTTGGCWFEGYWWWVCPSGQSDVGAEIRGVAGLQRRHRGSYPRRDGYVRGADSRAVELRAAERALSRCPSESATTPAPGFNGNFPDTQAQFGSGDPYSAGIVNGPLSAFSDQSGSLPAPFSMSQGVFSVAGRRPHGAHAS